MNNVFDSLWKDIEVKINDRSISDAKSTWYAYKVYLENHLSYSNGTKNLLSYSAYFYDTPTKFDDCGSESGSMITESLNNGFVKWKKMFAGSKWVFFCTNIHNEKIFTTWCENLI